MKLLKYLIIRATTKGSNEAINVYKTLYKPKVVTIPTEPLPIVKSVINVPNSPYKPMDKKQEMIESLEYLKGKSVKTKQDKESISMLEAILKSMLDR
jgi:hypothetical protein